MATVNVYARQWQMRRCHPCMHAFTADAATLPSTYPCMHAQKIMMRRRRAHMHERQMWRCHPCPGAASRCCTGPGGLYGGRLLYENGLYGDGLYGDGL